MIPIEIKLLQLEEGFSETPYYCTEGYPTIGTGHKIGLKGAPLSHYRFKISRAVDSVWTSEKVDEIKATLKTKFAWFARLNAERQAVIISMCYQLGIDGFSKFKHTIELIDRGDYVEAGKEMLDSKWHQQTTARSERHATAFATGDFYSVDEYRGLLCLDF